jgi:hypothetical protein
MRDGSGNTWYRDPRTGERLHPEEAGERLERLPARLILFIASDNVLPGALAFPLLAEVE